MELLLWNDKINFVKLKEKNFSKNKSNFVMCKR